MNFTDLLMLRLRKPRPCILAGVLVALAGCSGPSSRPLVFHDRPVGAVAAQLPAITDPTAALTGQRPVRRADPAVSGWGSLSSVPDRPTEFSSPVERQALLDRLQADRAEAETAAGQVRGEAVPAPAPARKKPPARIPESAPKVPAPLPSGN